MTMTLTDVTNRTDAELDLEDLRSGVNLQWPVLDLSAEAWAAVQELEKIVRRLRHLTEPLGGAALYLQANPLLLLKYTDQIRTACTVIERACMLQAIKQELDKKQPIQSESVSKPDPSVQGVSDPLDGFIE